MSATLTDRYIAATVKSLPGSVQEDVRTELEASILDDVDARIEAGEPPEEAERAVLTALGDPAVLAAGYSNQPLHLIGPRYFIAWRRLLKLLLIIVPICAFGGVAFAQVLANSSPGEVIGQALGVGLASVVHVCFWVTLVFVILERTGADAGTTWDVDQLPDWQETGTGRSDLIATLVFLGLALGAVAWDQLRGFIHVDGESVPILAPQLWPWWMIGLLGLLVFEAVFAIVLYRRRRWSTALAIANTALAILFLSWAMTLLGRGDLFSTELIELALSNGVSQDTLRILAVIFGFGVVGTSCWDIADGWWKTRSTSQQANNASSV